MSNTDSSSDLAQEVVLNHRMILERPGRRFVGVSESRWGELILPAPDEGASRPTAGMRVVLFASFEFGYLALEAVKAYAKQFPDRVQLAGLVTDDPVNPTAHIGLKKRVWKYVDRDETLPSRRPSSRRRCERVCRPIRARSRSMHFATSSPPGAQTPSSVAFSVK